MHVLRGGKMSMMMVTYPGKPSVQTSMDPFIIKHPYIQVLRGYWSGGNLHTSSASFHVVVTSYQIVVSDFKYFNKLAWQYMVLDEAQAGGQTRTIYFINL